MDKAVWYLKRCDLFERLTDAEAKNWLREPGVEDAGTPAASLTKGRPLDAPGWR